MTLTDPSSLKAAADAIRSRRVSSVEMTAAAISRAKASHERLNAFIDIEEEPALAAAKAADAALASGQSTGPLHGVPLAHKDMYDRAGFVTGCGSKIRAGHVATSTSTVMARLEAADLGVRRDVVAVDRDVVAALDDLRERAALLRHTRDLVDAGDGGQRRLHHDGQVGHLRRPASSGRTRGRRCR